MSHKFGFKQHFGSKGSGQRGSSSSSSGSQNPEKSDGNNFWRELFGLQQATRPNTAIRESGGSTGASDDRPRVQIVNPKYRPLPSKVYVPPGSRFNVVGPQGGQRGKYVLNKAGEWEKTC